MARRPDPRQPSLFDVLEAVPAGPVVRPAADPDWSARLLELVAKGLPPGAPSPTREIVAVSPDARWMDGRVYSIFSEVIMSDGARHKFRVSWWDRGRDYTFGLAFGAQPPRKRPYAWYYPAIRWDGRRWVRGEHSMDCHEAGWDAELTDGAWTLRGRAVAA